jgi:hypothetical protein
MSFTIGDAVEYNFDEIGVDDDSRSFYGEVIKVNSEEVVGIVVRWHYNGLTLNCSYSAKELCKVCVNIDHLKLVNKANYIKDCPGKVWKPRRP